MFELSDQVKHKFVNTICIDEEWEIETDSGWDPLESIGKTIPYLKYKIILENGFFLSGADNHIVFLDNFIQVFLKDIKIGDEIITIAGVSKVIDIIKTDTYENMYDVVVNSSTHRYYSNGILSHNTVIAAGFLLWYAMFNPDSTVLIAAHKFSGAQEIMQRIRFAYESCPEHIRAGAKNYNRGSIEFDNESRIVAQTTTETTGRGMSIAVLYADEFSFVRPSIARNFISSILPTLSTGGKCIITSTPNSDEDQFAYIWNQANKCIDEFGNKTELGINGFKALKVLWQQHPDRDETWEKEMRSKLSAEKFDREMNCMFIAADDTLINSYSLGELHGIDPIERQGQIRWYKKPEKGKIYFVALDPSLGVGADPAAIQVFEGPNLIQVAEWQHNRTPITKQIGILKAITEYLVEQTGDTTNVYYTIESNTLGEAGLVVISEIGEENIPGIFLSERGKRKGFGTTAKSKLTACSKLKNLIEMKKMKILSKNLISELKTFISSGASFSAKIGETDDLVMATLLIIRMVQTLKQYDQILDSTFSDNLESIIEPMPFILL